MIFYLINIFIIFIFIALFLVVRKSNRNWSKLDDYLGKVTSTVNSVRYGNLTKKIENVELSNYKNLAESLNRMVETLNDREKMIVEYQNELTRQNKFLESVINSLSDGITIIDEHYKMLRITPNIQHWFNEDGKKLIGQNILDYIQPKDNIKLDKFKNTEVFVKTYGNADFEATTMKLVLDDRKKRYIVILKDITNEKEIAKLREDFVATLTHDLKVPIIAESNILEFLLSGKFGEINPKQHEVISNMKNSNAELLELVYILLDTYKVENSGIELNKEKIELNPFLEKIVNEMQPIADKQRIKIIFDSKENLQVSIDTLQFERVIKNLIQNALSHSNTDKDIKVELKTDQTLTKISIIDYGQGIPKSDLHKIFDKYYSTAKKFRKIGTGLGLYLSQQIVKAHGGKITVKSSENVCTEFCVQLPKL